MTVLRVLAGRVVRTSGTAVAGLGLILQLGSCSRASSTADAQAASGRGGGRGGDAAAVPVSTAKAVEKAIPVAVTTIGTGEAISTVEIRAQITGQLEQVNFTEGDFVDKGQLLFVIDPRPFEVAVQQAQATLAKDQATAQNAEVARARSEDLYNRQLLARSDYDTAVATAGSAAATVQADKAAVDNAQLQLQYTKIESPVSGRTGALMVHVGSIVRTTDTTPMVVINQIAPIYVTFAVPGQYLGQIRAGQAQAPLSVQARLQDSDKKVAGAVSFIDNAIDTTTGTIKIKATFPNTDHMLWPGALAEVRLVLSIDPHAITVPATAVQNGQQGQYVFIVGGDRTVTMRPVSVARLEGTDAVISSGLHAGDEVVTDGQLRLIPGARITTKNPGPATDSGAGKTGA